jgi:hypothetical protein
MTPDRWTRLLQRLALGAALGVVFTAVFPRSGPLGWDFFDALTVACCFTLLGGLVDGALQLLPDIDVGAGPLVRIAGWFAGGLWCAVVARWLWHLYGRDLAELPAVWWGGVLLVLSEGGRTMLARRALRSSAP